ncbi:hypothetical protein MMC24_006897 [Lignoscripta atroalba]|nr:hypothetical protein [Lignoscripta atroalba]
MELAWPVTVWHPTIPEEKEKELIAISQRNFEVSPLLRLPAEIRNKIWYHLLGGNLFHIYGETGNLFHWLCTQPLAEATTCRNKRCIPVPFNGDDALYVSDCHVSHEQLVTHHGYGPNESDESGLAVLRTCRQIYTEASVVYFQGNTFSFQHPETFEGFLRTLHINQTHRFPTSIHISAQWSDPAANTWDNLITPVLVCQLHALQSLTLCLTASQSLHISFLMESCPEYYQQGIFREQALPLQAATAILHHCQKRNHWVQWELDESLSPGAGIRANSVRMSAAQKRELIEGVKAELAERRMPKVRRRGRKSGTGWEGSLWHENMLNKDKWGRPLRRN